MPIIPASAVPMRKAVDKIRARSLVSSEHGAKSLTVREVIIQPGSMGRLHTHPTDQAIMVTAGAIQMIVGDETQTVRSGFTMVAPPGVPHKLINNLWVPATLLVIDATGNLETNFLEE